MLTKSKLNNVEIKDKLYKLKVSQGLYVVIYPTGKKVFRRDYTFKGKRKTITFGDYPYLTIDEAIQKNLVAKKNVLEGIDPSEIKSNKKNSIYFENLNELDERLNFQTIAMEWWTHAMKTRTDGYAFKVRRNLEMYVFPWVGKKRINEIKLSEMIVVLQKIQDLKIIETSHRVKTIVKNIFRYARQKDIENVMVFDDDFKGALLPSTEKHYPTFTKPRDIGLLLQSFDDFKGTYTVKCALLLAPLVFTRPGELRQAKWIDIDFEHKMWKFKATKKRREDTQEYHLVPLSNQAVKILKDLKDYSNGNEFVFSGHRSKVNSMSDAAVNKALRSLGYNTSTDITGHGFRAMARTILRERLKFETELIEHQLAHQVADTLGTAYNRTKHIPERVIMMQKYADYLDELKATDWSKVEKTVDEIYG